MEPVLLDATGHRRSPATMPGYHRGRPPRNKGEQYPADPPTVEEIVAVMRTISVRADGDRLRALIVLLWRAGLRISEGLALHERPGSVSWRGPCPAWEGWQAPRGGDGPLGLGAARFLARDPPTAPPWGAALRDPRTDLGATLGGVSRAEAAAPCRRRGGA
jgi:hypothetical protein